MVPHKDTTYSPGQITALFMAQANCKLMLFFNRILFRSRDHKACYIMLVMMVNSVGV